MRANANVARMHRDQLSIGMPQRTVGFRYQEELEMNWRRRVYARSVELDFQTGDLSCPVGAVKGEVF